LKSFSILLLVALLTHSATGQEFENYIPLQATGAIPSDFTISSSNKYKEAKANLDESNEKPESKESKQDFLLESNFLIDQVLSSGRVLFNDPLSAYLGQILDTVLVDDPKLRKEVRVYAVKSSVVNSFTTDNGIILVNIGLIAQLENEAQLAFILCHELTHYTEKHVITAYLQNEEIKKGSGEFKRSTFDKKLLAQSQYSQDLEKEADRAGLERFSKTNYSNESLLNVFEVMRYAHLPFDDIAFDKDFFDQNYYKINDSYFLNRVRPVESNEADRTSKATHPSPTDRQQMMSRVLAQPSQQPGSNYLVSKDEFFRLREVCRFELSSLYLKANRPIQSIYNSFLLSKEHPDNFYLTKSISKSLYTLSKFKTGGNYGQVHPGFSHIEGESQQLYHLFYRLKPEELAVLATGYTWRLRNKYPEDADLKAMSEDLLQDLLLRYYVPGMIAQSRPPEGWDQPDTTQAKSKYDRLKQKSKNNPRLTMIKYGLVDLFDDPEFAQLFGELEQKKWNAEGVESSAFERKKKTKEEIRYWKNHGFSLGANKVVVVSPTYAKLDLRKNRKHKFLRSESAKGKLIKQINKSTNLLNLESEILDRSMLDSSNVDAFNDITFLNEWVDKRFVQSDVSMINLSTNRIDEIIKKYDTENFVWTGIINYRENKPLMYFYLLYALVPPAIPFAVYYMVRPNYDTYYYCITFNLRTGEPVLVNYNNYRKRDARDMINSSVYDSYWQMKDPRKKKKKS
jgi:Zn-dependent protease with chaperone function